MNLKYQRDIYFLLITIILFVVGFAVPIDQKDDKFLTLKKNYESNSKYLKKSKNIRLFNTTISNDLSLNILEKSRNEFTY